MAFLKDQKAKSGFVISIQDLGLNTTLATKQQTRTKAKEVLTKVQHRIDQLNKNKDDEFFQYNLKEKRHFVSSGHRPIKPQDQQLCLQQAIAEFVEHKQQTGRALQTTKNYQALLERALSFFGNKPLNDLSPAKLQDYVFWLQNQTIAKGRNIGHMLGVKSQKKYMLKLSMLCKWAVAQQKASVDLQIFNSITYKPEQTTRLSKLTSWVDFEHRQQELDRFGIDPATENAFAEIIFTKTQLLELLEYLEQKLWNQGAFDDKRFFAAVYFVAFTGIRRSEVPRVRKSDLYLENQEATVWLRKGRKDEELKAHKRYLPSFVIPYLEWLVAETPAYQQSVFVSDDQHIDGASFDQKEERKKADGLTRKLKSAYISSKWENAAGFHKFRHSLASILLVEGRTQQEVKETIGWCSDEMAQRYQHLAMHRKKEIIESVFA